MKAAFSLILLVGSIFCATMLQAQVYHIDPNAEGTLPGAIVKSMNSSNSGIVLSNSAAVDVSILLSDDKVKWDTIKMLKMSNLSYQSRTKYIKIYTSADKFTYALLNTGYAYTIYWDKSSMKWNIK